MQKRHLGPKLFGAGVGAGMQMINFISSIYYNMLMGWALYYMFASWQKILPWSGCTNSYNTPCMLPCSHDNVGYVLVGYSSIASAGASGGARGAWPPLGKIWPPQPRGLPINQL